MPDVDFAPANPELRFARGDTVPPITIPVNDENGDPIDTSLYDLTAETIGPTGTRNPATGGKTSGNVSFALTPDQSALVEEDSQWCVRLATPDQSDVRTVVLGRVTLIIK